MKIRAATFEDLPAIVEIYNEIIEEGGYTADLSAFNTNERRDWFDEVNNDQYGIYVVTVDEMIIGHFYFSPWRKGREALKNTAEISFYLDKKNRGKGLGKELLRKVVEIGSEKGFSNLLAILLDTNIRSRMLLGNHGFEIVGTLKDVGKINGESIGQLIMQLKIPDGSYT